VLAKFFATATEPAAFFTSEGDKASKWRFVDTAASAPLQPPLTAEQLPAPLLPLSLPLDLSLELPLDLTAFTA
jgi:hypothetical protein